MKLASFRLDTGLAWGEVADGTINHIVQGDLADALRDGTVDTLLAGAGDRTLPLDEVRLLPPVPTPQKILCIGLNYSDHIAEMGRETPAKPTVFTRYPDSLVGDGAPLIAPRASTRFDYEGELAIVIGRGGRDILVDDALSHVLGYTIMNDGTVRDYQRHTTQFTPGKNFPESGSLGPWIVTADEIGSIGPQRIVTTVNGLVVQDSSLDQLVFGVAALISYISEWTRLSPGDVIATGTPGGVGDGRNPALYLFPGDVVRVEIDGIGSLTNPVADA